jgi:hypothetical protein
MEPSLRTDPDQQGASPLPASFDIDPSVLGSTTPAPARCLPSHSKACIIRIRTPCPSRISTFTWGVPFP